MRYSKVLDILIRASLLALPTLGADYRVVYQFPEQPYVDLENVGTRFNGHLLLSFITSPTIYLLDPNASSPEPRLLQTYPNAATSLGIAEVDTDVFAIVVGNYTIATHKGIQGSFAIWTLDLRQGLPGVTTHVTDVPEALALNGATTCPGDPNVVYVADSGLGAIWRVDTTSGTYTKVVQNAMFEPSEHIALGINGIRCHEQNLYFANSAQGIFGKVPICPKGKQSGRVDKIATALTSNYIFDDFNIDRYGDAYIAAHPNQIIRITSSGNQTLMANDTAFDQPSSAAFGRTACDRCTAYFVTAGSPQTGSGAVMALDTC